MTFVPGGMVGATQIVVLGSSTVVSAGVVEDTLVALFSPSGAVELAELASSIPSKVLVVVLKLNVGVVLVVVDVVVVVVVVVVVLVVVVVNHFEMSSSAFTVWVW